MIKEIKVETIALKIDSSFIKKIEHNYRLRTLKIEMINGNVYKFYKLPEEVIIALLKSESQGKFFDAEIKGKYNSEKIK